ncbi:MAG: glycosyltransferase [Gemmatimonadaceae bacterium]|nr:glycosyltransferase [Gemmatimonadaceae bacterium]MBX9857472.1 glycosyltransferase [Gemmatimonadaceae bacterium]
MAETGDSGHETGNGVGVVIPCHNEADSIASVIRGIRSSLPLSRIVVVDNASTDGTGEVARAAGAEVVVEPRLGKGFALLRGFQELANARLVIMIDGDGTYSSAHAPQLIAAAQRADLVIATRLDHSTNGAFSFTHSIGNRLFILLVRLLFGLHTADLLSGYRVLSRRLLDTLPLLSTGFEVETEITIHALVSGYPVAEVSAPYSARAAGGKSKIRTYHDGSKILLAVLAYFRDYRPLSCFGAIGGALVAGGLWAGSYPVLEYLETGMVNRLPLAVLAVGLVLLAAMSVIAGLILSSVNRRSAEMMSRLRRIEVQQRIGKTV